MRNNVVCELVMITKIMLGKDLSVRVESLPFIVFLDHIKNEETT